MTQEIVAGGGQEAAARAAYEVQTRIIRRVRAMRRAWVELAEDLYLFDSAQMYRDLGYDSIGEWMADPDVEVERRWGYQLLATWREFVVKRGVEPEKLAEVEPSKLQEVLPAVRRNEVTLGQALADVESLSRDDLRERYIQRPDTTTHYEATDEPERAICPNCGQWYKVRSEDA